MYVILTYDIGVKRNAKVLKICRKYLHHVQRSVFEGSITEGKLKKLQKELSKIILVEEDAICIYRFASLRYTNKLELGINLTEDSFI